MVFYTHTEATAMDKVYEQAFKRQRVEEQKKSTQCEGKEDRKEDSSWGSLPRPSASACFEIHTW